MKTALLTIVIWFPIIGLADIGPVQFADSSSSAYGRKWGTETDPTCARFSDWAISYLATTQGLPWRFDISAAVQLAAQRRDIIEKMIRTNPAEAISYSVPIVIRDKLPTEIVDLLEVRVSGRGEYRVIIAEPEMNIPGQEHIERWVVMSNTTYQAYVYGRRVWQTSKSDIPLHGIAVNGTLALHESPVRWLESEETPGDNTSIMDLSQNAVLSPRSMAVCGNQTLIANNEAAVSEYELAQVQAESSLGPQVPQATSWTEGLQKVLVLRVDFSDRPGASLSTAEAQNTMDNQVRPWFESVSYSKTTLQTTVAPLLYRMPRVSSAYTASNDIQRLYNDALIASSNDFNAATYDRIILAFANVFNGFSGWANYGEKTIWVNGPFWDTVLIHELGHTYGLWHANLWSVKDGNPVSSIGTNLEYGDVYDNMGGASLITSQGHFNPWFKSLLNWLPPASVKIAETTGVYRVYRFDDAGADITNHFMAIKVPRGDEHDYWIGVRRRDLGLYPSLSNAAYIVWGYHQNQESHLLDMRTPGTNINDAPLQLGNTFTDKLSGITLKPVNMGGSTPNEWMDIQVDWLLPAYDLFVRTNGNDNAAGTNWVTAKATIQAAVDAALFRSTVWVSNGIYNTGGRTVMGQTLVNRVLINKPITLMSVNGPSNTVIQGNGPVGTSAVRCVFISGNATLNGFTLNGGATRAANYSYGYQDGDGGGLYGVVGQSRVTNCILNGNVSARYGGGAMGCTLFNCIIISNSAAESGGGVYGGTVNNCTISANLASSGGGAQSSTLNGCYISGNSATWGGGTRECTLNNCTLSNNSASSDGGGVYGGIVNNCILIRNTSSNWGGGAHYAVLNNCMFNGNKAIVGGGASISTLNNCTLSSNQANNNCGGAISGTLNNSIVYYNSAPSSSNYDSSVTLNYCCTVPMPSSGIGNITNSPGFADASTGNYRLRQDSFCVGKGDNTSVVGNTDLDGYPRIVGSKVDLGAYEYPFTTSGVYGVWLRQYSLPTDGSADFIDSDGDSFNNRQEYFAGTDPTNTASVFRFTMFDREGTNGFVLRWPSISNRFYSLRRSTNLYLGTNGFVFVAGASNLPGYPAENIYTDRVSVSGGIFYRIDVRQ